MSVNVTEHENKILKILSNNLPLNKEPFRQIAEEIGLSEEDVINSIISLKKRGIIRRISARINHNKAGISTNILIVWKFNDLITEESAAQILAGHEEISHLYSRPAFPGFPYTLYSMMHFKNKDESETFINKISNSFKHDGFAVLPTIKEFKKSIFNL